MTFRLGTLSLLALTMAASATAQHSPYMEHRGRAIKALSAEEVEGLLAGAGMGLALAAELNGYPGPKHVLELADELELTAEQRSAVERVHGEMAREAVAVGERVIEAERRLDALFAGGEAAPEGLRALLDELGRLRANLRYTHLAAHIETRAILSADQVRRYDHLRGYTGADAESRHHHEAAAGAPEPSAAAPHTAHDLGTVEFPVSCSEAAQPAFERAVALLHHMTYPLAREAFEGVAELDPRCAMAHWGIAVTLFQPLWPTRPSPEELRRGWEAVERARALAPATERERLFIAAAEAFFDEPESTDYWGRIRRWEQAMERAFAALPEDPEVAAFYALAHLAVAPSDRVSRANADRAAEILMTVYERNPDHPGAMHYLVHANDVPGREREALEIVRKYETVAPENPHALHMPTHIYTRLGDWQGVIRGNLQAAEAALAHPAGDRGELVWDEFPHMIEYLVYAHLQRGADAEAVAQLRRLLGTERLQPTFKTAFHLASTQARYALERRAWNEAMALVPRHPPTLDWDRFVWPEAVTWFARGLGAARAGDPAAARQALARLEALEDSAAGMGEELFARNVRILRLGVAGWLAQLDGDAERSEAWLREAAELEATTPKHAVTPGPTLPAPELLGDLLLEQGRPEAALAAYQRSLELYPRRFNSLLGAARAARAGGDPSLARRYYRELEELAGESGRAALEETAAFLGHR